MYLVLTGIGVIMKGGKLFPCPTADTHIYVKLALVGL